MKLKRIALLLTSALGLGACDESGTDPILAPNPALAYTRFIHAVPDTSATDWTFIDRIDYSPKMMGMTYRQFSPYQGTYPGSRQLRIFPTSTNPAVTSQYLIDATITLTAGKYYTIIHTGYARTGSTPADKIVVMEDAHPVTVAATEFATRFVNLGVGLPAQDVYAVPTANTTIVGATPLFTGIAYENQSAYANRPTGAMAFRAANTTTTTVSASALAPAGQPKDDTNYLTAIAGTGQGGSVFTGYFFPRSVAGSLAPQGTAFQSPAIIYLYDRHPK